MKNRSFPRWSALLIGPAVGALIGLRQGAAGGLPFWAFLAGSAGIGFLAGLIIFLLEPGKSATTRRKEPDPFEAADRFLRGQPADTAGETSLETNQTLVGRFLAILGIALLWAPLINLAIAVAAFLVNRRTQGWPRGVSIAALILALGITIFLTVGLILFP